MTRVHMIRTPIASVVLGALTATLGACTAEPKPAVPTNIAAARETPAPRATPAEQPIAVGDVIAQYRHCDVHGFVDGAKEMIRLPQDRARGQG